MSVEVMGGGGSANLQSKSVLPSLLPYTQTPDPGYDGLSSVEVRKPSTLIASNIKKGVSIFNVTGTLNPAKSEASGTLTPTTIDGKVCIKLAGVPSTATKITAVNIIPKSTVTGTPLIYLWWYTVGGVQIDNDTTSLTQYLGAALLPGGAGVTTSIAFFRSGNGIYLYAVGRGSDGLYTITFDTAAQYVVYAMYE